MTSDFFRFPHTPHLAWLGTGSPRDDKLLTPQEANKLLDGEVVVEEKLDGANLGISLGPDGQLRAQNRGQYLIAPFTGQFSRLKSWLTQHQWNLADRLGSQHILFGEWCAARHTIDYDALPDWFMLFDVYDRTRQKFWSTARRNELARELGLAVVPKMLRGRVSLVDLEELLETRQSRFRAGQLEGVVVRRESDDWCEARGKLVKAEFTQAISEHWRRKTIQWNQVAPTKAMAK